MVTKEENRRTSGKLPLQQTLNIGDYAPGTLPAIKRITFF
jgi:hypothetical protein